MITSGEDIIFHNKQIIDLLEIPTTNDCHHHEKDKDEKSQNPSHFDIKESLKQIREEDDEDIIDEEESEKREIEKLIVEGKSIWDYITNLHENL